MTSNSNFPARADNAALALKRKLSADLGKEIAPRSVPVGSDGQPVPALPPEGSYARQAVERQRAAAEQARQQPPAPTPQQPPQQEMRQEPQGIQQPVQPPQQEEQFSANAQRRFSELTQHLREKDQQLQQEIARSKQLEESQAQLNARLTAIEASYNKVISQNLDSLDDDTRAQVLQQAAEAELSDRLERRVLEKISPHLREAKVSSIQAELAAVAAKYPGFEVQTHGPLIEIFRNQNPNCTIEQAFRAVAEPHELSSANARAPAIPPIAVAPNNNATPRYIPRPNTDPQQKTPEQEIEEDRKRAFELARSDDPRDKRMAGRAMDQYIARKLGNSLPGRR